jgi:hypothetical protein
VEQINFKKMLATLNDQGMIAIIQSNIVFHRHTKKLEPAGLGPYQAAEKQDLKKKLNSDAKLPCHGLE